ncbi:MAG TPA: hypothetical protein PLP33_27465 [Leptospiraceae bacterium]|nr:hypothetical protein [Leptospiraceae bacterium]
MMNALVKIGKIEPEVIREIKDEHVNFIKSFFDLNKVYYDKDQKEDYRL